MDPTSSSLLHLIRLCAVRKDAGGDEWRELLREIDGLIRSGFSAHGSGRDLEEFLDQFPGWLFVRDKISMVERALRKKTGSGEVRGQEQEERFARNYLASIVKSAAKEFYRQSRRHDDTHSAEILHAESREPRQKMKAGEVSVLEELYDFDVPKLDEGIRASIALPMYARFQQERRGFGEAHWYPTSGYFFLSDQGFLVVVRDGVLRTARFPKAGASVMHVNLSKRELFIAARKQVIASLRKTHYIDTKDKEEVRQVSWALVVPENWTGRPPL